MEELLVPLGSPQAAVGLPSGYLLEEVEHLEERPQFLHEEEEEEPFQQELERGPCLAEEEDHP